MLADGHARVVQGYLRKCGSGLPSQASSWRKRWVVLRDSQLGVFKGSACVESRSALNVSGAGVHLEEDEGGSESRISVVASDGQSLLLAARDPTTAKQWIEELHSASRRPRHEGDDDMLENPAARPGP